MRTILIRILPLCVLAIVAATNRGETATKETAKKDSSIQPASTADGVRTITMPSIAPPELADGPNKDLYAANCVLCHTPRYVTMQPRFPRKVWTGEVEKMKKVYGAPIDDAKIPSIVDYLMLVNGVETAASQPSGKP